METLILAPASFHVFPQCLYNGILIALHQCMLFHDYTIPPSSVWYLGRGSGQK